MVNQPRTAAFFALLLLSCSIGSAWGDVEVKSGALWIQGVIDRAMADRFRDHLKPAMPIVLSSPGGDLGTAIRMSDAVHRFANPVVVKDRCYSACVLIFVMSPTRWMQPGSKIGIHGVGRPDASVDPEREQQIRGHWTRLYIAQIRRGSPALADALVQRDLMASFDRMTYLALPDLDTIDPGWAKKAPQDLVQALAVATGGPADGATTTTHFTQQERKPYALPAATMDRLDPASYRGWDALGGGITAAIVGPAMRAIGMKHAFDAERPVPCATVLHFCR